MLESLTTLPKDLNAEMAVLGCMIQYSESIGEVLKELEPSDFFGVFNRTVFEVLVEMARDTEMIDLVTISSMLERKDLLEKVGGHSYLVSLIERVADRANLSYYIKIVKDKSLLRQLIQGTKKIEETTGKDIEVDDILKEAEKIIFEIAERRVTVDFIHIGDAATQVLSDIEAYKSGAKTGIGVLTGFRDLDRYTMGFHPGQLIILAARTGVGKTAFALNTAVNVAADGSGVGIFSLEMYSTELVLRILCSEASVRSDKIKSGRINNHELNRLRKAAEKIKKLSIKIDSSTANNPIDIKIKTRRLKKDFEKKSISLGLIVIDYLQLLDPIPGSNKKYESRTLEIAAMTRALKNLAQELQIPVLILAQLNRLADQTREPQLSQLRESGAIEQDADMVLFLYKDNENKRRTEQENYSPANDNLFKLKIAKQRQGRTGTINLVFIPEYTKFASITPRSEIASYQNYNPSMEQNNFSM